MGIILAAFVAAGMVIIQLNRQHKSGLKLQEESFKKELNLKIYMDITDIVNHANNAIGSVGIDIFSLSYKLEAGTGRTYFDPRNFNDSHHKACLLLADTLLVLEKYEITLPGFRIFRLAFNVQADRLREVFNVIHNDLIAYMRIDMEKNNKIYLEPTTDQLNTFKAHSEDYYETTADTASYLSDLQVAAQNKLLSDIFKGKVPTRMPTDPDYIAITADETRRETIIQYLRNKSPDQDKFEALLHEYALGN